MRVDITKQRAMPMAGQLPAIASPQLVAVIDALQEVGAPMRQFRKAIQADIAPLIRPLDDIRVAVDAMLARHFGVGFIKRKPRV